MFMCEAVLAYKAFLRYDSTMIQSDKFCAVKLDNYPQRFLIRLVQLK